MRLLSSNLEWKLANRLWAASLNPMISNPLNNAQILKDIPIEVGVNIINHKLGQIMNGWFLTDINAPAVIYRSAELNSKTLVLTSDLACIVSIGVF